MSTPKKSIAFFDFDETLTTKDSLGLFLRFFYQSRPIDFLIKSLMASPFVVFWKIGLISNHSAKEKLFSIFFKGMDSDLFHKRCVEFAQNAIPTILNPLAIEKLRFHQLAGHHVCVVSATFDAYLKPWCNEFNIDLLCTNIEVKAGILSGRFSSPNCYGPEKARRIKQTFSLSDFDEVYAYGDSKGDREMLELATHAFYRTFG